MRTYLKIESSACILLAMLILTLPLKWIAAALFAGFFHEICHISVILLCGGRISCIRVCAGGIVIETSQLTKQAELLCAMAGPCGSLFLLCFCQYLPRIALCALMQGLFNLMPIFPLDGGRILNCTTEILFSPDRAAGICRITEGITITGILLASVLGILWFQWGLPAAIVTIMLLIKALTRKIPCKDTKLRVQ